MRGGNVFISSAILTAAAALAQTPDYFPLDVGNVWIYRERQALVTVEVTRAEAIRGQIWYALSGYRQGEFWVRNDGAGRIFALDREQGEEKLWYDFGRREGEIYPTSLPTCCGRARVESRNASKKVALGEFDKVFFQLSYPGVFQVGITEEDFLPYVGLVFRSENTGGPSFRTQDLIYARLSGVTVLNASGIGFGVAAGSGYARIFLNNNTNEPMRLNHSGGFLYDLTVKDESGRELYRWTLGKLAPKEPRSTVVPPGETSWVVPLPPLPEAATLTGELLTDGMRFQATVPALR